MYYSGTLSSYWHPDWLGSSRLTSKTNRTVGVDIAFAPFGETYVYSGVADVIWTGSAYVDAVGDEYDFLYRQYHPLQGRWVSPDPAGLAAVDLTTPQSLNRYAYVRNRPTSLIDPRGLGPCTFRNGCRDPHVITHEPGLNYPGNGCTLDYLPINCNALLQAISAGITNVNSTTLSTVGGTATFQIPGGCVSVNGGPATCDQPQSVTIGVPGCGGIFGCFFAGFVNTFLNGSGKVGLAQLGGSLALAVGAVLSGGGTAAAETTTLYRAVSDAELSDILASGSYNPSPFGGEVKYFYPTEDQAYQFVQNGWASAITSVEVPTSLVNSSYTGVVAGEGPIIAIPNGAVPGLGPINVLP